MTDTTTIWDPVNARGDWVLQLPEVQQSLVQVPTPQQFGLGDGETVNFALTPPGQIISGLIAQIYRNDWQGNQLLYATPRTNRLTYSNAFSTSPWALADATLTSGAGTAPDGTATLWKLVEDATNTQHYVSRTDISITGGVTQTVTVFAKAAERQFFCLGFRSGSSWSGGQPSATFDLVNGVVNFKGAAPTTASIVPMGNGVYRCSVTAVAGAASFSSGPFLQLLAAGGTLGVAYTGDGVSGLYIWGAQDESGSVDTSYIPTTTAAVTVTDYVLAPNGIVTMSSAPVLLAALTWNGQYYVNDFTPGGFLQTGNDLETAYLISIFTDRIAQPGDVIPDGTNDARGWIGDAGAQYPIGSRLWLLERATKSQQTMNRARTYVTEALQWLLDDGVVAKHDITLAWVQGSPGTWGIGVWIQAYRPDGTKFPQFNWVWGQFQ